MGPKFQDLEEQNEIIQSSGVTDIISLSGAPFDAFKAATYSDGRAQIINDLADVVVGDKAYSGNVEGTVTAILDDGGDPAVNNRIEVTYLTPYMQKPNATTVENRKVEYNILDNTNADADGTNKVVSPNELSGQGVVFFRIIE